MSLAIEQLFFPRIRRLWRGVHSAVSGFSFPLGHWWLNDIEELSDPARLNHGLVLVLPGIEGRSPMNWSIAQGLNDGGIRAAIHIHDWTTGFWPLCLFHLRAGQRNRRQARILAQRIAAYQNQYPGRPVYLVGHSGGAALAVWALEALPEGRTITGAFLFAPALSPTYSLVRALQRTQHGIWNFCSTLDLLFLTIGTLLFRTLDDRHRVAAGYGGFVAPTELRSEEAQLYRSKLHQLRYRPAKLGQFHHGGHFGWANRIYVAESVAHLLHEQA